MTGNDIINVCVDLVMQRIIASATTSLTFFAQMVHEL